jgi:hypothetical protein
MDRLLQLPKQYLLYYFLICFISIEAINKVYSFYGSQDLLIQKGVKLIILILLLGLLIVKSPKKILFPIVMMLWFCLGQLLLQESFNHYVVIVFARYFLFIVLIIFFAEFPKLNSIQLQKITKFWEGFLWVNNLLIITSFIFGIALFKTYSGDRWGYNGLFMASANSTYFYLMAILYFLIRYPKKYFKNSLFWLSLVACFLNGTKSIYFGILLFGLISLASFKIPKKKKLIFIVGVFIFGALSIFLLFTSELFTKIIHEEGWVTAILSYRDELFIERTLPYLQENWNIWQYFTGGLSDPFIRPQMEIIDLFLYFGVLGMLLYLYIFLKNYFNFNLNNQQRAFFVVLFLVPVISGNFFYNASVPIYLIFLKLLVLNLNKNRPLEELSKM